MMQTEELRADNLIAAVEGEIESSAAAWREQGIEPRLAAVVTSADPSMLAYVRSKERFAGRYGIGCEIVELAGADQKTLEDRLDALSRDPAVHGIILELPLGPGLDLIRALDHIDPQKDVDGLSPANLGLALRGREEEALLSATAQSCVSLAESVGPLSGKRVALIGKGKTVGRPLVPLLLNRHATLSVGHAHTTDLAAVIKGADMVIIGIGQPGLIKKEHIEPGQIIIDAGLTVVDGELRGDVDRVSVEGVAAKVTPVPGGVGSLTTALLFRNLMKAMQLQGL